MKTIITLLLLCGAAVAQWIPTPNPGDPIKLSSGGASPAGSNGDVQMKSGAALAASGINCASGICTSMHWYIQKSVTAGTPGNANVFIGPATDTGVPATGNQTLTGSLGQNVGIGDKVLRSLTTGIHNVGIGPGSLDALTTGSSNFAMGHAAGIAMVTGSSNILIGDQPLLSATAMGSYNIIIGTSAMGGAVGTANVTSDNIAIGHSALTNATGNATNNICIGSNSCASSVAPGISVVVGDAADLVGNAAAATALGAQTSVTGNFAMALGARAVATAGGHVVIGNNNITDVYFGSETPVGILHAGGGSATTLVCWKSDGKTMGYATMAAGNISACN